MKIEHRASSPRQRRAHASKRRIGYTHPRLFRRSIARNARGFRRGQRRFRVSAPRLLTCARVLVPSRMSNRSYTRVSLTFTDARCSHSAYVRAYARASVFTNTEENRQTSYQLARVRGPLGERKVQRWCAHAFNICKLGRVCIYASVIPMYTSADRRGAGFVR